MNEAADLDRFCIMNYGHGRLAAKPGRNRRRNG